MGIVIIGGHDRMVCKYKEICRSYQYKVKVFTQMPADMKNVIGSPDLLVLFTNTVSHKMIHNAIKSGEKTGAAIVRSHSSSACALQKILADHCQKTTCQGCPNHLSQSQSLHH